jgi:ribosomal protein S6
MNYELFYLIAGSKEGEVSKIKDAVKTIVTEEGGVFDSKETTEKRRLAYKVKHETFGIYSAQRFALEDTEKFKTINRKLNLYPEVLRFIISRADELPELKSREERIEESAKAVAREKAIEARKEQKKAAPAEKQAEPAKKPKDEDIDKQLEEILNI